MPAKTAAKRTYRRRKPRGKYLKGKVEQDCSLGALGPKTLVSCVSQEVASERLKISSIELIWALKDLAIVVDDGPVIVGVAHSDYTAAEIEEVIENSGSWSEGNLTAQEIAKRKVRIVGVFRQIGVAAEAAQTFVLNEGRPIKTKLNWILTTAKGLDFWAYNAGPNALTTGSVMSIYGHANLWAL